MSFHEAGLRLDGAGAVIALLVRFELARGEEEAFDALLVATCAGIRVHEPGTLVYVVTRDPDRPSARILFEVYRDEAAFRDHESQPHVRAFLEARTAHLAGPIVVERLDVTELATGAGAAATDPGFVSDEPRLSS